MQCTANKARGGKCKADAIKGGTVCRMHGGSAPQVKLAAQARLMAMVDPALGKLAKLIQSKSDPVALGAVKDILDRTGFKPTEKIEVSGDLATRLVSARKRANA